MVLRFCVLVGVVIGELVRGGFEGEEWVLSYGLIFAELGVRVVI